MTYRERLIEVMARELWAIECDEANAINIRAGRGSINYADPWKPHGGGIRQAKYAEEQASRLIEAAERAGFLIVAPDDGR